MNKKPPMWAIKAADNLHALDGLYRTPEVLKENAAIIAAHAPDAEALALALEKIRRECNEDSPLAIHEPTTKGQWDTERIRRIKAIVREIKDQLSAAHPVQSSTE